jgi:hypothetical protein
MGLKGIKENTTQTNFGNGGGENTMVKMSS